MNNLTLKDEDLCRGINYEEDNIYQLPPRGGQPGPDRFYPFTLKEENDNSTNKEVGNNYIMQTPPSPGETGNIGLKTKNNDKGKEPTKNPNKRTYVNLSGHVGELRNLKIMKKPVIKPQKILKRKADATITSLIYPPKKQKCCEDECIVKSNDQSSTITPTTPAFTVPPDAVPLDEQADPNHPHNVFTTSPPNKRLIDTGKNVEEVTDAISSENFNTTELDISCLQESKMIIDGTTDKITYIDKDGKSLRMSDGGDQTEIIRVVWKSIGKPECERQHGEGIMEKGNSENITINMNSGVITDHKADFSNLVKLKRTGQTQETTTSELRIHSNTIRTNIEDKNIQPNRRCKRKTVQGNKIQPDRKVLKNKTTTQNTRKEKNKFEDDNTKLGLALKTWLENTKENKN